MKRYLIWFFFVIFISTGCAEIAKRDNQIRAPATLEPQAVLKFSDIPIPAGFKLLPEASYSFENSGLRVGLLKYEGRADVDLVVNFYKEQMVLYNWRLLNVVEYGQRLLNFDREQETCIINLLPKGKNLTITISIGPKPQSAKKPDRPLK